VSFPFEVLALGTLLFLATIPISIARFRRLDREDARRPPSDEMPERDLPPTI
jgi:hypothetical protein